EAVNFYLGIFKDGRISSTSRFVEAGKEIHGREAGSVMAIAFELFGQTFTALNGGPMFKFSEAISLQVNCETQAEIDELWEKLGAGGDPQAQQCGWLKDKFGLSWQIVPSIMPELFSSPDKAKQERTMNAMLKMKKLDIHGLLNA
ncbi:MAG TPA: VOC family protein, partial [Caulifigura sp.]|nr:VOC family protein [Caulifigura sp.]